MNNNESDLGLGISSVSPGTPAEIQSSKNIGELNILRLGSIGL